MELNKKTRKVKVISWLSCTHEEYRTQSPTVCVASQAKLTLHPTNKLHSHTMYNQFAACFDCWSVFAFCAFWPQTVNGQVPPMDVICDNKNRPCVLKLKLTYFFLAFPVVSFTFLHTQTLLSAPVSVHYRALFNNFEFMLPLSITSC